MSELMHGPTIGEPERALIANCEELGLLTEWTEPTFDMDWGNARLPMDEVERLRDELTKVLDRAGGIE